LNANEYATNIGLALKPMRPDINQARVNINAMPEAYLPKPVPIIQIISWAFIPIAIAVLLLLGISTLQAFSQTQLLQAEILDAQTQILTRQGKASTMAELRAKIDEAKNKRDYFKPSLNLTKEQRAKVNSSLSKVTSLLPGIVELASISYIQRTTKTETTHTLIINGISPDETTIVNYVRDLRNSGQFSEVLISDMRETQLNEWQFTLTVK
jgi:hypothetical protein